MPEKWHHLSASQVLERLKTDSDRGLDEDEVRRRRERFGANALTPQQGTGALLRFLLQFHQPLVYILLAAGLISAILQEWVDAGVIFAVVLVNALIGFVQEAKALKAMAALARTMDTESTVIRAGQQRRISAGDLVPGDVVVLQSGDRVPADLRLLQCRELRIDESALTGESLPVTKHVDGLDQDTLLADRSNMAYSSTLVSYGAGKGVVTVIGDQTEIGRIGELIAGADVLATPLTRKIARFSRVLLWSILVLAAVTLLVGVLRGESLLPMFMAAVALAVGAIPEGLPAALTITLAIGVARMAKRHAIVRKLPAVETLGSTTVICSDKTGTLTQNQMTVQAILAGGERFTVSGTGYAPDGTCLRADTAVNPAVNSALMECLRAGLLCNDARLVNTQEGWRVEGDPTEGALITAATKAGLDLALLQAEWPRLDAVPFESLYQYMATLHDAGADQPRPVYVKGAVERILSRCNAVLDAEGQRQDLDSAAIHEQIDEMTAQGLRVLAFAYKYLPATRTAIAHEDVASGLTFLGLQGMLDPPRPEAVQAVQRCLTAGVRVKMITGDHLGTATVIAHRLGLNGADGAPFAIDGKTIDTLSDEALMETVADTAVFARVAPEQKLRLVKALQARGHVVAMTGDGVNDAPALSQADIGVAMGNSGTEVAKEAADIVLTDDNFATIAAAVEEGRGIFDNLIKFITWTLPTNIGMGLVILVAVFAGLTLPVLPVQILWINMTTVVLLGLMLAFEPREPELMQRPPRDPHGRILNGALLFRIFFVGVLLLLGTFSLFQCSLSQGAGEAVARTVAVNVFVFSGIFYLFNCRSLTRSLFSVGVFSNRWLLAGVGLMIVLQWCYTYTPIMHRVFGSAPLGLIEWLLIIGVGMAIYGLVGVEKWLRQYRHILNAVL